MTWWEVITGSDMNQQMHAFDQRIAALPADYQAAWQVIGQQVWCGVNGGSFSGRDLMPVLDGISALMVETADVGLSVEAALGTDLAAFVADVSRESGVISPRERWRQKLNADVHRQLGR